MGGLIYLEKNYLKTLLVSLPLCPLGAKQATFTGKVTIDIGNIIIILENL